METNKICPNCRKPLPPDVPLGLCPECLIKSGFPTEGGGEVSGEAAGARFMPPPIEEIAHLFPQLEILGLIGKGGMGAVYKARQPALDRFVALKVLPPAVGSDPGFAERFNREARALARLNHPNIVAVHDFGKAGPLHYLVMEFVDGTNLREVERAGRLSPDQALAIVPQICEALQFAHNEGIVHRDIKPENLLIDKRGRLKITDFGIAKIVGQPAGKVALTGAKDVVGTPHYMAPEQIEKPAAVDHRADIYSLGVVFYEMLTGELPLGKFSPPSKKVQVDVRLDEVVLHTLEKEPERRYQQVSQVKTDVETIAGALPPAAGRAGIMPSTSAGAAGKTTSDKALLPALLLAFPLGVFGAHRFYAGKTGTAFLQLGAVVSCGLLIIACATLGAAVQPIAGILLGFMILGCLVWAVIDWILIVCRAFTDGQGRRMSYWLHPQNGDLKTRPSSIAGPPSMKPPGGVATPASAGPIPTPAPEPSARATAAPPSRAGYWPWIAAGIAAAGLVVLGLTIAVALALHPTGAKPNLTVRGTVTDAMTGKPIVGARVDDNRYGASPKQSPQAAWTDRDGHYQLKTWYEEHNIAASAPGYETQLETLLTKPFGSERERQMDFKLQPQAANPTPAPLTYQWRYSTNPPAPPVEMEAAPPAPAAPPVPPVPAVPPAPPVPLVPAVPAVPTVPPAPSAPLTPAALPAPASARVSPDAKPAETPSQPSAHRDYVVSPLSTTDPFREEFNQTLPFAADGRLSLDNVDGRIEIAGWDRNEIVIKALKHGKTRECVDAAKINMTTSPDQISIHTEQPSSKTGFPSSWFSLKNSKKNDAVVDYAIQVPQNARLKTVSSVNGRIVIEGVSGNIEASAVNGEMQVEDAAGDLKLSTVNGRIDAKLISLGHGQSVSLETVNGRIGITLPANADAEVAADTVNGSISSEFASLAVKKEFPISSNLRGTLGKGGARVKATTVNGGIHIRQGKDTR